MWRNRQVRIFCRSDVYHMLWAETILGGVVAPFVKIAEPAWFWFSRYDCTPEHDSNDCAIGEIPAGYMRKGRYRSLRLRYRIADVGLERKLLELIEEGSYWASDCRDWNELEIAQQNYVEPPYTEERRHARAASVLRVYDAWSRLALECLQGPNKEGWFWLPHHANDHNRTVLMQVRHIFLNAMMGPWERIQSEIIAEDD